MLRVANVCQLRSCRVFSSSTGQLLNFIDGENVHAKAHDHPTLAKISPVTGQVLYHIPRSGRDDIDYAVSVAKKAFPTWSRTAINDRSQLLLAIADGIQQRFNQFVEAESEDTGKPIKLAREIDIPRAIDNFKFFASAVKHLPTSTYHMDSPVRALNYTSHRPLGVVGLITPWNLPIYLLSWKVAPALAMGNTIVAKPSEMTPHTATLLATLCQEVGLPNGVLNVVHGFGAEVGQPLLENHDVKAISFTGGTETGALVAGTASSRFAKVSLELGGKNPGIVFADCDIEKTVKTITKSAFLNSGQICLCSSRLYVEKPIYEEFVSLLVDKVKKFKIGLPNDPETHIGPVISRNQMEKILSYIEDATDEGGKILCGGKPPKLSKPYSDGCFIEPTVIANLPISCRTTTEEIFGPVLTVHPFTSESEVIEIANAVKYGLSASLFTSNVSRALRISESIETGTVWVNNWLVRDLRVPFGGVKASGLGAEGGFHSLEFFSELKNTCVSYD